MIKLSEIGLSVVAGAFFMFLLMKGCYNYPDPVIQYKPGKTVYDTIYRSDTIRITKPEPYYVESIHTDTAYFSYIGHCDSIRYYRNGLDSAGISINVASQVNGLLLSQEITYRLPQVNASRTDTVLIATEAQGKPFAALASYNTLDRTVSVGGAYISPKSIVTGTYNLTNKSINVGYGIRF